MTLVECNCDWCGKVHTKPDKEVKRKLKHGGRFYCSKACSGKALSLRHKRPESYCNSEKAKNVFRSYQSVSCSNKRDEFSPFRKFLRSCNSRKVSKDLEVNLTLEYLKEVWEHQRGICPYLKSTLVLGKTNNPNLQASLDRIDSSKGYVIGNVQFISMTLNYAKSSYSEDILFNLISLLVKAYGPDRISTANVGNVTQAKVI